MALEITEVAPELERNSKPSHGRSRSRRRADADNYAADDLSAHMLVLQKRTNHGVFRWMALALLSGAVVAGILVVMLGK
jgi:hypothetical protein